MFFPTIGSAATVAFARAGVQSTNVLLLDEPTSDLDPQNTAVVEEVVRKAGARRSVVATHDVHQDER